MGRGQRSAIQPTRDSGLAFRPKHSLTGDYARLSELLLTNADCDGRCRCLRAATLQSPSRLIVSDQQLTKQASLKTERCSI